MTKILLVEDDKSLREIYGVRLLAEGYDIVSAGDGEEALAMAIKDRPSLIISDVMMPKISGFDMLDILRSTTETKEIKVIMMTALSSEEQRQRGVSLGADRYLVKSQVGIEDVVRTVHEILGDAPVAGQPPLVSKPAEPAAAAPAAPAPAPSSSINVPPRPATTPTPVAAGPGAQSTPPAPAPAPAAPTPAAGSTSLPQPTAPFSTPRNTNSTLADRVIQPLDSSAKTESPDFGNLMNQELSAGTTPAPAAPAAPSPSPVAPAPAAVSSNIDFEETPRPAGPQPPAPSAS